MNRLLLLFLLIAFQTQAQVDLQLSNGFNIIKKKHQYYGKVHRKIGRPDLVRKDSVDQWFCSMSRGQNIRFWYAKFAVTIHTRKSLAPFRQHRFHRGENDYTKCRVHGMVVGGNSVLRLNQKRFCDISASNIESLLGVPLKKTTTLPLWLPDTTTFSPKFRHLLPETELIEYKYYDLMSRAVFTFYFMPAGEMIVAEVENQVVPVR